LELFDAGASMALLATKLYVPSVRPDVLFRSRLAEQLNLGLLHPLTLISAPAGYGKTTVISSWVAACQNPVAWLTLDEGDNDPVRFWRYVDAAFQKVDDDLGKSLRSALFSAQAPDVEQIIVGMINDITASGKKLILVLEDYHLIENAAVHTGINFLLDNIPPQMHIFITTRSDPPLHLGLRRGRRQITEIRSSDLRFTSDETSTFINHTMQLALAEDDILSLAQRTEGWIAGLQLAVLSLQQQPDKHAFVSAFAGDDRYVMEYLLEEVLQRQPTEIQTFLLKTSFLERLSEPLCQAVTSQPDGQSILEYLEQANLFVSSLDNRRYWYRYHALFADLLRRRLHQTMSSQEYMELIHRACAWYVGEGLIVEAISQAFASSHYILAAQLLEKYVVEVFFSSETMLVHHWLKSLPEEVLVQSPLLCTTFANTCAHAGTFQEEALQQSVHWLDAAEKALAITAPDRSNDDLARGFIGLSRAYMSLWRKDSPQITVDLARHALAGLPPEGTFSPDQNFQRLRSGLTNNLGISYFALGDEVSALHAFIETQRIAEGCGDWLNWYTAVANQCIILTKHGHLSEALAVCRQALAARAGSEGELEHLAPYASVLYQTMGLIQLEWNELDEAETALRKSLELSRLIAAGNWGATGSIGLSRLQLARSNLTEAFAVLHQVKLESFQSKDMISAWKVRLYLADSREHSDALKNALQWADGKSLQPFERSWTSLAMMSLIRVMIAQHRRKTQLTSGVLPDLRTLQEFLTEEIQNAEACDYIERLVELHLLQSLAWHSLNRLPKALESLMKALVTAMPGGYVRLFVDEGDPVEKMLARLSGDLREQPQLTSYVSKILSAFKVTIQSPKQTDELIEALTEREMEVLRYIAQGCTNPEIAGHLYISPNTLKAHSQNIFMKLNVHNRLQAVNRARELGLIE
jgi:ATP/maltotriose-dependent transcriptional regulator MalT